MYNFIRKVVTYVRLQKQTEDFEDVLQSVVDRLGRCDIRFPVCVDHVGQHAVFHFTGIFIYFIVRVDDHIGDRDFAADTIV